MAHENALIPWEDIDKTSKTWKAVLAFLDVETAANSVVIDDPGQRMVAIRSAQGAKRILDKLRSLPEKPDPDKEPEHEPYPTGAPEA